MDPYTAHFASRRLRQRDRLENAGSGPLDKVRVHNSGGIEIGVEVGGKGLGDEAREMIGRR